MYVLVIIKGGFGGWDFLFRHRVLWVEREASAVCSLFDWLVRADIVM